MQIDTDTLEIQRAKKAAKIASEVSGEDHTDLKTPIFVLNKSYQQLDCAWNLSNCGLVQFGMEIISNHDVYLKIYSFHFAHRL